MANWQDYFEVVNPNYIGSLQYQYDTQDGRSFTSIFNTTAFIYKHYKDTKLPENLPMPPTNNFMFMFYRCHSLQNIDALKNWYTQNVTNMNNMFRECHSLQNINALSKWNTFNAIDMDNMFCECHSLQNIDALSSWYTGNVKYMSGMLSNCYSLQNIDTLKNWNTFNATNIRYLR